MNTFKMTAAAAMVAFGMSAQANAQGLLSNLFGVNQPNTYSNTICGPNGCTVVPNSSVNPGYRPNYGAPGQAPTTGWLNNTQYQGWNGSVPLQTLPPARTRGNEPYSVPYSNQNNYGNHNHHGNHPGAGGYPVWPNNGHSNGNRYDDQYGNRNPLNHNPTFTSTPSSPGLINWIRPQPVNRLF